MDESTSHRQKNKTPTISPALYPEIFGAHLKKIFSVDAYISSPK